MENAIAWSSSMQKELSESLSIKERQRVVIENAVANFLCKGGQIKKLPALDDKASRSLLANLESYLEFQHLDSEDLAKNSQIDD